jgi:VPDSG-CTERM motif
MKTNKSTFRLWLHCGLIGMALAIGVPVAHATGFSLGDAANYAVIFQGGGGNKLGINNGAAAAGLAVSGNIGVAGTGKLALSGPLVINGNIDFAGSVNPSGYTTPVAPYTSGGNITVNGTITGSHTAVQNDMNYMNGLSHDLWFNGGSSVFGSAISLNSGTTINASSGSLDALGDTVFNVTSMNLPNGNVTINGDGVHKVVINVSSVANFHANMITLGGGLTPDDVIWNFYGNPSTSQIANLTGGPTLDINANSSSDAANILQGIFLDPYGTISAVNAVINGRIYGGDSHDEQIVSGAYINAPTNVPDGGITAALLGLALLGMGGLKRKMGKV